MSMAICYSVCGIQSRFFVWMYVILYSTNRMFCSEANNISAVNRSSYLREGSDEDYIYNLTAKVIYNVSEQMLQYHVSWKIEPPDNVTVSVNAESMDCGTIDSEYANGAELMIPQINNYEPYYELVHECLYEIVVMDSKGHSSRINHTIPVCVDGICDCDKIRKQKNVSVQHENDDKFLVRWIYLDNDEGSMIKNIKFGASKPNSNCTQELSSKEIAEPEYEFITNNSARLHSNTTFPVCFLINFTYTHDCYDLILRDAIPEEEREQDLAWINISISVPLVILLLIIIGFWYSDKCRKIIKVVLTAKVFSRSKRTNASNVYGYTTNRAKRNETNLLYIEQEIAEGLADSYELPRNHLELFNEIGKGAFGEVYLGKAFINSTQMRVAVKTLRAKSSNEEMEDFLSEIEVMKKIGRHPNIVTMLKSCTLQEPYMMIMEYLPFGDLKNYLVNLREKWSIKRNSTGGSASNTVSNPPSNQISANTQKSQSTASASEDNFTSDLEQILDHTELQRFAFQIANGMAHLEKIPIAHRDLAARNILIDKNKTLKISDFGLSRPGPYFNKNRSKLPLRWMALEAIEDHLYDNKSDVWSFGIVLWEIGTLGAFPYGEVPNKMLLYFLQIGKRLARPEICTDELYTLMLRCWSADPQLRPTFCELVQQLDVARSQVYIDFTQLNPLYVFPPTKAEHKTRIKHDQMDAPK